jgi:hypothetical protein
LELWNYIGTFDERFGYNFIAESVKGRFQMKMPYEENAGSLSAAGVHPCCILTDNFTLINV